MEPRARGLPRATAPCHGAAAPPTSTQSRRAVLHPEPDAHLHPEPEGRPPQATSDRGRGGGWAVASSCPRARPSG